MTQLQFFKAGFIVLIVLNLALVTFLIIGQPNGDIPPHAHQDPNPFKQEMIRILDLNKDQQVEFEKLANAHHDDMVKLEDKQKALLRPYFNGLINPEQSIDNESLLMEVEHLERQKLELTYNHFMDIKAMLSESQLPRFKEFTNRAVGRILVDDKNRPHPPKDLKTPGV